MNFLKKNWAFVLILLTYPLLQIYIGTKHSFISDSLIKAMQAESLFQNHFQTEEVLYPGGEWDPGKQLSILEGMGLFSRGRFIGQYPIAFTAFLAVLRSFGFVWEILPTVLFVFIPIAFYLLGEFGKIKQKNLLLLLFGTVLFPSLIDVNEAPLFFMIVTMGFLYWIRFRETESSKHLFLSLFFLSLGSFFRHESILFLVSIFAAELWEKRKQISFFLSIRTLLFVLAGFLPLIAFLIWNQLDYGHILGPRFIFNYGKDTASIGERAIRFISIIFTYISNVPKFGFFLCSPFLLLPLLHSIRGNSLLGQNKNASFLIRFSVLFILLIAVSAPNDGVTISGRYLLLAILPLFFLYEIWTALDLSKGWRIAQKVSIVFSLILLVLEVFVFKASAKQLKQAKEFIVSQDAEVMMFTNPVFCGQAGLEHIRKVVYCIHSKNEWEKPLRSILDRKEISEFTLFGEEEELRKKFAGYENQFNDSDLKKLHSLLSEKFIPEPPKSHKIGYLAQKYVRKSIP